MDDSLDHAREKYAPDIGDDWNRNWIVSLAPLGAGCLPLSPLPELSLLHFFVLHATSGGAIGSCFKLFPDDFFLRFFSMPSGPSKAGGTAAASSIRD